jgi:hypothetical protein
MPPADAASAPRASQPSSYRAAVVLSGMSAVLGLARDVLVLRRLGLGAENDRLQLALSVTYTVSLLGDPLRLAALNLLGRRIGVGLGALVGGSIAFTAALIAILYGWGSDLVPRAWLLAAGCAGAANLGFAWVLPRRQRAGPFLPVHSVTVLPNVLIVLGLLVPAAAPEAFSARVVGLFLLAPLVQLIALGLLFLSGERASLEPAPRVSEAMPPVLWHVAGAAGTQATQLFLRTALLAAPAGTLSAFVLVLRATETIRAVFVDSYIASRVRRWADGERTSSPVMDGRWLGSLPLALVTAGGLLIALWRPRGNGPPGLVSPAALVLVLGTYLILALRVRYQSLNTRARPLPLVKRMAGLELICAASVGLMSAVSWVPIAMLPWAVYVAKPAAGLRLLAAEPGPAAALVPEG